MDGLGPGKGSIGPGGGTNDFCSSKYKRSSCSGVLVFRTGLLKLIHTILLSGVGPVSQAKILRHDFFLKIFLKFFLEFPINKFMGKNLRSFVNFSLVSLLSMMIFSSSEAGDVSIIDQLTRVYQASAYVFDGTVVQLESGSTNWTLPGGKVRLGPATKVTFRVNRWVKNGTEAISEANEFTLTFAAGKQITGKSKRERDFWPPHCAKFRVGERAVVLAKKNRDFICPLSSPLWGKIGVTTDQNLNAGRGGEGDSSFLIVSDSQDNLGLYLLPSLSKDINPTPPVIVKLDGTVASGQDLNAQVSGDWSGDLQQLQLLPIKLDTFISKLTVFGASR